MKVDFIKTTDELPGYGVPVLIRIKGTVQHITYALSGVDEGDDYHPDWFEPFLFAAVNDELIILATEVDEWAYFPNKGEREKSTNPTSEKLINELAEAKAEIKQMQAFCIIEVNKAIRKGYIEGKDFEKARIKELLGLGLDK